MEANDMKAMRKTLEEMATELEDLASRDGIRAPAYSSIFSIYAEKCRKALGAPPRNCDVHTAEELKTIFKSELVSELPIANEHEKNLVTIAAMGVIDTLFETAKGEDSDGSK